LKTTQKIKCYENLLVEAELFHVHGHLDSQTWWC